MIVVACIMDIYFCRSTDKEPCQSVLSVYCLSVNHVQTEGQRHAFLNQVHYPRVVGRYIKIFLTTSRRHGRERASLSSCRSVGQSRTAGRRPVESWGIPAAKRDHQRKPDFL